MFETDCHDWWICSIYDSNLRLSRTSQRNWIVVLYEMTMIAKRNRTTIFYDPKVNENGINISIWIKMFSRIASSALQKEILRRVFSCTVSFPSRLMEKVHVISTYHSPHNRSGPTSSKRCASTLLNATRKYAKKLRICRLTSLVSNVRSVLPKAEYNNLDVIILLNIIDEMNNTTHFFYLEWLTQ